MTKHTKEDHFPGMERLGQPYNPNEDHGNQGPGKLNALAILGVFFGSVDDSELSTLIDKETTQGDRLEFGPGEAVH